MFNIVNIPKEMKKYYFVYVLVLISAVCSHSFAQTQKTVNYVDPFIGTDFFGHTFPGPALPNSLVHLGPDVGTQGWNLAAGYIYQSNSIIGFSHTHWSGVGMVAGGDVLLMPTVNTIMQVNPGTENVIDDGYRSRYSHEHEEASVGYYAVDLLDYDISVELTTTQRVGFHTYTFPESKNARVIIDLGHSIGGNNLENQNHIKIINKTQIEGYKESNKGRIYFIAEFSKPFKYIGTFDRDFVAPESGHGIFPYKNEEEGLNIGAFVQFHTTENEQIMVKVALSYVSIKGAKKNLEAEIPHWDFEKTKKQAESIWSRELSKVKVKGGNLAQKQIFYTSIYRSLLAQYISQDIDGRYIGIDGEIKIAKDYNFYGSFSCWDTYRTQHPLLTLIKPEDVNDYIKSIQAKTESYGWLPAQHFLNRFGQGMVGDHLIPIIVDAYVKGFRDYDVDFLYKAMRIKAMENPKSPIPEYAGRSGLDDYLELGYAPIDKVTEAIPNTLELAYDDWCIAQMAHGMAKDDDYKIFMQRADNYKNVWDSKTQFMRPKKANGEWLTLIGDREQGVINTESGHSYYQYFDPLLIGRRPNRHYTESNAWQYIWSVQHNPLGLIDLFGSKDSFINKLDSLFVMSTKVSSPKYVGVVGTIGQYVQGNQPSHHVAYFYNYVGQPWKTQEKTRQILNTLYQNGPGGLCGNEDMGSLSSWYVLSAMGIYPFAPGSGYYTISSPLFDEVKLDIRNGNAFTIIAENNSKENKYIQSASLNGKAFSRTYITHKEITDGGILIFKMGKNPNKEWGLECMPAQ